MYPTRYYANRVKHKRHGSVWASVRRHLPLSLVLLFVVVLVVPIQTSLRNVGRLSDELEVAHRAWLELCIRRTTGRITDAMLTEYLETIESFFSGEALLRLVAYIPELGTAVTRLEETIRQITVPERFENDESWGEAAILVNERFIRLRATVAEIDRQRNEAYRSIPLFFAVFTLGLAALYAYQATQIVSLRRDTEYRERIAAITHQVQEEERTRLAFELHDGAAQGLALANMTVDQLPESPDKHRLKEAISSSLAEIRAISRRMRPPVSIGGDPAQAIRELVADLIPADCTVHLELPNELTVTWNEDYFLHYYRIAQEALVNVVRHARASTITIRLSELEYNRIALTIRDDGIGIGTQPEGLGRRGMSGRAELLGGEIHWLTPPDGGTTVELVVPQRIHNKNA